MARKVRRPRRRRQEKKATSTAAEETKSLTAQEEFEQEYAYVLKDLRWVFILAAIMFTLLIVLNLILTV